MKWHSILVVANAIVLAAASTAVAASYIFTAIGTYDTCAFDINNSGTIVGYYYDDDGAHGFSLSGTTWTKLDYPGAVVTRAMGINNAGTIVGEYSDGSAYYGFSLTGTTWTKLDYPVYDINNAGTMVGYGFSLSGTTYSTVKYPGAPSSYSWGINDAGIIVGEYGTSTGTHGYYLTGATYTTLNHPTGPGSPAVGINNTGTIVGYYDDEQGTHGYVLTDNTFSTVDYPGSDLTHVYGINDSGYMVGVYNGQHSAFLATPVPEPATMIFLGLGPIGLAVIWRRRSSMLNVGTSHFFFSFLLSTFLSLRPLLFRSVFDVGSLHSFLLRPPAPDF